MLPHRRNTLKFALACGVALAWAASARADTSFRPVGDLLATGSWSQQWEFDGTGAGFPSGNVKTDLIMFEILSPGNTFDNDVLGTPPFSPLFGFTDTMGFPETSWSWTNLMNGDTQVTATGDAVLSLRFYTHHAEGTVPPDGFTMRINWWDAANTNPSALAYEAVTVKYVDSSQGWVVSSSTVSPLGRDGATGLTTVPVPGAMLLGVMGMSLVGLVRRRFS